MSALINRTFFVICYVNVQGDSDIQFIENELKGFCATDVQKALSAYSKRYTDIMLDLSIPAHERTGKARKECNTRLRRYVQARKGQGVRNGNGRVGKSR